jgi:hypothetical protein
MSDRVSLELKIYAHVEISGSLHDGKGREDVDVRRLYATINLIW